MDEHGWTMCQNPESLAFYGYLAPSVVTGLEPSSWTNFWKLFFKAEPVRGEVLAKNLGGSVILAVTEATR